MDNGGLELMSWPYRNYSTYLGRWFQPEKLGMIPNDNQKINPFGVRNQYRDELNLYQAFASNPTSKLDIYGLVAWPPDPAEPPGPWCRASPPPPKSHTAAYDWWNPLTPRGIKCEKPCKWRNDSDVKYRYYEDGCFSISGSLPVGPGCGAGLAVIGALWEAIGPTLELCNGPLVEKFKCQCRLHLRRYCKSKCCDRHHGVWTDRTKIRKTFVGYGRAVRRWGSLRCSCNPFDPGFSSRDEFNKALKCK